MKRSLLRLLAPEDFSDRRIIRLHRQIEYGSLLVVVTACVLIALLTDAGRDVAPSFMPTVAQIVPVLFIAQLVDNAFFAQRLATEVGAADSERELAHRYLTVTAKATLATFLVAEAAALYGVASGATTLTVALVIGAGVLQALDLALGVGLRGAFRPTALARMIALRKTHSGA
jgi:hypothetical protein